MAKKPTITTIASGYYSRQALNNNFTALRDALDNTVSRDGSTPNTMTADFDLNGNDILNAKDITADRISVGGSLLSASPVIVNADTVNFTPTGTLASTDVQAALAEINTDLSASTGSSLVGYTQGGAGSVATTVQSKFRESVSVKDFGAVGDGVTDDTLAIQAAIDHVNTLTQKPAIVIDGGRYLITSTLQLYPNISITGVGRDTGYTFGFSHSSEIIAGSALFAIFDVTGSNIYIGNLGLYGNTVADYGLYSVGAFGRMSGNTFENLAITLCNKSGVYMQNGGLTKLRNCQISNCNECGIDMQGWGDTDIEGCFINTMNFDSTSTVNGPSSAVVYGVGIRLRKDSVSGGQTGNINIRGGKVEFCRVGILMNAAQGINISSVNFDSNRKASVFIESDSIPLPVSKTTYSSDVCSSIQITGNRFLGGLPSTQTPSAHILVNYSRYITIVGNGFKRADDAAGDFFGTFPTQGQTYGIWLFNAENCTVVGNDLAYGAVTNELLVQNLTAATAQHTIYSNSQDGTSLVDVGTVLTAVSYADTNYVSGATPNANNTAKAWVRFNGATNAITDSFNVASVTGGGGTYTITAVENWGVNAAVVVSARNWFGPSDTAMTGAVTASTAIVYSATGGALSANGDITAYIFAG
jgi:hypothetical protein